jgi:hypothetical protein
MDFMKKIIVAIVFASMVFPVLSFADTTVQATSGTDMRTLYENSIKQVIALLMQEVAALEAQLTMESHTTTGMNSSSSAPVACTQEAKLCPDGSYVGRSGPACAFAACPAVSSLTATSTTTEPMISVTVPSSTVSATYIPAATSGISAASISQTGKMPREKIGTITVGASNAGPIELGSLKLTFGGNGYTAGSSTFLNTVTLKDQNNVDVSSSFGATVTRDAGAGTMSWTFPTTAASPLVISSGSHLTLQLWGETDVIPGISGTAESLSAIIQNSGDLTFYDGADSAAIATGPIPLSVTEVPIIVSSLSWGQGM